MRVRRLGAVGAVAAILLATFVLGVPPAGGALPAVPPAATPGSTTTTYAPPDRSGPPLTVPRAALRSALSCTGDLATNPREAVLLVPGTTLTPREFAWNYVPALRARGRALCTVTLPHHAMSDIPTSAQYVVYAIRRMHALSGRKVQIIGHSQGGMIPRWALRFWPATRGMVDDVVGLAPSNHGTYDANVACALACAPSFYQQEHGSHFDHALNSYQETFPGISYTDIYTRNDEVVVPNATDRGSSSLHGGGGWITNVAIQAVCPLDRSDHLALGTYDPVGYALAIDALTHPGPADPARVPRSVCAQAFMPGIDPATFPGNEAALLATVAQQVVTYPRVSREPPLPCYVYATGCG